MSNFTSTEYKLADYWNGSKLVGEFANKINQEISAHQEKLDQEARILHTINALSRLNEKLMRWDE